MDRAQQFALPQHVLVVPGDEIDDWDLMRLAIARPQRADALESRRKRDHGAGGQRHADVAADGRGVPDLERHQERVDAVTEQGNRPPFGGALESMQIYY